MSVETSSESHEKLKEQKTTKRRLIIYTIIYLCFFPFALIFSLFSFMVFDDPGMTIFLGLFIMSIFFIVPLSILVYIFLIWRKYFNREKGTNAY